MDQVALAGSSLSVSSVVLGTMTFGAQVKADEADLMVRTALDAGVTMFDTSNNYAGGASEEILGRALAGRREDVVVATKGGSPVDQSDASLAGLGRRALVGAVEASLRRLGTDRIDVYYLHRPDPATPFEETLTVLQELVQAGKVLHIGQSNFAAWQVTELNAIARAIGAPPVLISQPMYNLLGRRVEEEYVACSRYLGLTNITYNPLAGGLLTGKHRPDEIPSEGSRFSREVYRDRYWNDQLFDAVDRLREVALGAGLRLVELALRWVVQQPFSDCMLVGASSVDQLRANLEAANGAPLSDDVMAACDDVWAGLRGAAPAYNR